MEKRIRSYRGAPVPSQLTLVVEQKPYQVQSTKTKVTKEGAESENRA
jgi:hypothetical protein